MAVCQDDDLTDLHMQLGVIPLMSGYSPARWWMGVNVMLPKKVGDFMVTNMQMILLYDAKFNGLLKWLGRQLMLMAERLDLLAPEQYGSHSGLATIYHSLNMQLSLDIIRQNKIPAAICSNDAKSCYDRIVHSFAAIALMCLGVPMNPIRMMFVTIHELKHFIRMAHGDSKRFFSGTKSGKPNQGVGQGNGVGPQIWAAISSPIFEYFANKGIG